MSAPLVRRSPTHQGQVVAAAQLTPRMRRVTVQADSMIGIELRPAQDVELHLTDGTGRRVKRRYTIRRTRPEHGELDLDVALHGAGTGAGPLYGGPGAQWGARAAPGDPISFQGPRGKLELRSAATHLLIGDESALPAIASITEALADDERAIAVVEIADAAEEQPLPCANVLCWVHRDGAPPGTPDHLLPVVAEILGEIPVDGTRGYLMGETRTMVALRAVLESHGLDHDAIFLKGYWNPAKR